MNERNSCDALWSKRLEDLTAVWPKFLSGDVKGLHRARVASRRIREALPVVAATASRAKVKRLHKKVREVTRVLGPIRELDVELELIEAADTPGSPHRRALALMRREVASRRRALRKDLKGHDIVDVDKLMKKLSRIAVACTPQDEEPADWRIALSLRTLRRTRRLRSAVEDAGPLYVPERIHAVRIATKKLRYVLEVVREAGLLQAGPFLRSLKRQQARLGRLHDLQLLLHRVREVESSSQAAVRLADLTAYADSIDQECRRLHAEFVDERDVLLKIANEVRQRLVPAVTTQRLKTARVARPRKGTGGRVRAG